MMTFGQISLRNHGEMRLHCMSHTISTLLCTIRSTFFYFHYCQNYSAKYCNVSINKFFTKQVVDVYFASLAFALIISEYS